MSEQRINIISRNDNHTFEKRVCMQLQKGFHFSASGGKKADRQVRIIFAVQAVRQLFDVIGWGSRYRPGDVECAGILLGKYYLDDSSENEIRWAEVRQIVPADPHLVHASFTEINITADAWRKMYEDASRFRDDGYQIVGWYHTHLDTIAPRFSGVDISTQHMNFTYTYSFGVVFNPNQCRWSAYYGPESKECIGELCLNGELLAQYQSAHSAFEKPQIQIVRVNGDSELQEDGSVIHFDEERKEPEEVVSFGQLVSQFMTGLQKLWNSKQAQKSLSVTRYTRNSVSRSSEWESLVNSAGNSAVPNIPQVTINHWTPASSSAGTVGVFRYSSEGISGEQMKMQYILNDITAIAVALQRMQISERQYYIRLTGEPPRMKIELCPSADSNGRIILIEQLPRLSELPGTVQSILKSSSASLEYLVFLQLKNTEMNILLIIIDSSTENSHKIRENDVETLESITGGNNEQSERDNLQ